MHHSWHLAKLLVLSIISVTHAALPACSNSSTADYDFIVVGAGAGGGPVAARLAENGFSVLLVDAGDDINTLNTTLPAYLGRATEDPATQLNYTLNEYPAGFPFQRPDSWYPRAGALGGSTIHNAMINVISATRGDYQLIRDLSGRDDNSWSREAMHSYFKRIENNTYLIPLVSSATHGFKGWLQTSLLPWRVLANNPLFADPQLLSVTATLAAGLPVVDPESPASDASEGVVVPSFTIAANHVRSSVYNRLVAAKNSLPKGRLDFALNTLATKVLLCNAGNGTIPRAYGVEVAPGAALPVSSKFKGKTTLTVHSVTARHEVIVSAGAFQSPQLLMLSGIGERAQLQKFGIETVVDLPGVGKNLQDHEEVSIIWQMKQNYTLFKNCMFLYTPESDGCLKFWLDHDHLNLYAFSPVLDAVVSRSESNKAVEPDIMTYFSPGFFRGFFRGFAQEIADHHNSLTAIILKAHSHSRGTVSLTGSSPQDRVDIQKNRFQGDGGRQDVVDMREAIKRARRIVNGVTNLFLDKEVIPGSDAASDEQIEEHIYRNAFGHHVCCTNSMGGDNDPNAVLNTDFQVRGVDRLRVVDLSSWPQVPGFFVTTPTYMISEKAADLLTEAARRR